MAGSFERVSARLLSVGGGILSGMFLVLAVLAWIALREFGQGSLVFLACLFLFLLLILYAVNGLGERLVFDGTHLTFQAPLQRTQTVPFSSSHDVHVVFEGLNLEHGIISLEIRCSTSQARRISLGPLWRWRDLQSFFGRLEAQMNGSGRIRFSR